MKNIFIALILVLVSGCSGFSPKSRTLAPAPGPTQETILGMAKTEHVSTLFRDWLAKETVVLQVFLTRKYKIPVKIFTLGIVQLNDYETVLVGVMFTMPNRVIAASLVISRGSSGGWTINTVVSRAITEENDDDDDDDEETKYDYPGEQDVKL